MKNSDILKKFVAVTPKHCHQSSYFFSFEGIEGAGKSTLINSFKEHLEKQGKNCLLLREPGGTSFGEKLREAILQSKAPLHPLAEAHLFASSRAQLLAEKILPHLAKPNSVVLLDRYIDSSLVYQGVGRKLGMETILELHQHFPLHLMPHKTFYLAIDANTSVQRQAKRGQDPDYFESEQITFTNSLIQGYEELQQLFSERLCQLDGAQAPQQLFAQLLQQWNLISAKS